MKSEQQVPALTFASVFVFAVAGLDTGFALWLINGDDEQSPAPLTDVSQPSKQPKQPKESSSALFLGLKGLAELGTLAHLLPLDFSLRLSCPRALSLHRMHTLFPLFLAPASFALTLALSCARAPAIKRPCIAPDCLS